MSKRENIFSCGQLRAVKNSACCVNDHTAEILQCSAVFCFNLILCTQYYVRWSTRSIISTAFTLGWAAGRAPSMEKKTCTSKN